MAVAAASAARSSRPTCAARRRSPRCSRSSTCAASRRATSRRAWPRCSGDDASGLSPTAITRLTAAWQADYEPSRSATSRTATTSTSGPTASTSASGWRRTASVRAGDDRRATGRDEGADRHRGRLPGEHGELGRRCCAISSAAGCALPSWPWATAHSASGRRCATCGPRRASNAAGCTGSRTCSTSSRSASTRRPRRRSTRSCAPRRGRLRSRPSRGSRPTTGPSTRRPWPRCAADEERAARLLRLPGRALAAPANGERDRVALRHGAPAPTGDQGRGLAPEGPAHALDSLRPPSRPACLVPDPSGASRGALPRCPEPHRLSARRAPKNLDSVALFVRCLLVKKVLSFIGGGGHGP